MKITRTLGCLAAITVLAAATIARGVAQVGDTFTVQFKAVDGSTISSDALKGHLVVYDFWATWCGPCMQMVPHMVELNQKYGDKGLQIVGISLDQDQAAMKQVTKEKGMVWPEYFDGAVWNNKIWKQYGSNGIPFTVLVSPAGKVLFAGHPAGGLDQAIETAFKNDPPQLVDPKVLSAANGTLDTIEQKITAGETRDAIKLLSKIPADAKADGKFVERATSVQKKLEEAANSLLAEVQTQIDQEKYTDAVVHLKELAAALTGLPEASKATSMLNSLMSNPKAKTAIAAAERNAKADDDLAVARKLQAQKKDEQAYARFKEVVRVYSGTDAAAQAQEQVTLYEKDTDFIKRITDKEVSGKAIAALHMGDSYKASGAIEMARKKYQSVIDQFPGTSYAELARKSLGEIANQ